MTTLLDQIRIPSRTTPFPKAFFHTVFVTCLGLLLGVLSKLLDRYTTNLGNVFSQMSVWIFLCTLLSIYSSTPKRAAVNVFFFCLGMLSAYYVTAMITNSVYSALFASGWTIFSLFSPILAICVWYAAGTGWIANIITIGVIASAILIALFLFDTIRISDVGFSFLTGVFLRKHHKATMK